MKAIVNFLFEVGMLKKTPRSGYQFLGSGKESVAEHSFRTAIIAYTLALQETGADSRKAALMSLLYDLPEARTGDQNYVNKRYVKADEEKAIKDQTKDLPFGDEIVSLFTEFNEEESLEARISKDADQIDFILELKEQQDLGNKYAKDWLYYAKKRLITKSAKQMVEEILQTDSTDWWFHKKTELWVNGPNHNKKNG